MFPKKLPGGRSVYDADVLSAVEGLHYFEFDFVRDMNQDFLLRTNAGIPTATRQTFVQPWGPEPAFAVVLSTGGALELFMVDNATASNGRQAVARQRVSLGFDIYDTDVIDPPQKGAYYYDLTKGYQMNIYQATIQAGKIYIAYVRQGPNAKKYKYGNLPATQWAVINVANVTTRLEKSGFRTMSGAFLESKGFVDTSAIGNDTAAFYPAVSVNAAGNAGAFCSPSPRNIHALVKVSRIALVIHVVPHCCAGDDVMQCLT